MTVESIECAIKLLDPKTTASEVRKIEMAASSEQEAFDKSIEAINETCEIDCRIMREYISKEEHS